MFGLHCVLALDTEVWPPVPRVSGSTPRTPSGVWICGMLQYWSPLRDRHSYALPIFALCGLLNSDASSVLFCHIVNKRDAFRWLSNSYTVSIMFVIVDSMRNDLHLAVLWGRYKVLTVHSIKAYRGSRDISPLIRNVGTRWRRVVIFVF